MHKLESKKKKIDFSQPAIKKAVLRHSVEHPSVVYPAVLGVLGGVGMMILGAGPALVGLFATGGVVAGVSWVVQYGFRQDILSGEYVKKLLADIEQERVHKIEQLGKDLKAVGSDEAKNQFKRLQEKYQAFHALLDQKLNPGEMAHTRFLGATEQVFLGVIDNLQSVLHTMKSSHAIDATYIRNRIEQLEANGIEEQEKRELQTLQPRLALYEKQMDRINDLLVRNEEAMTQMDVTLNAITEINGNNQQASLDLETAMQELQRMADRAKDY